MRRWPQNTPRDPEERYRYVYGIAYRVALRMLKNTTAAEDLAQDVWIATERWLDRYTSGSGPELKRFDQWVHRVSVNRTINLYKSKWQQVLRDQSGPGAGEEEGRGEQRLKRLWGPTALHPDAAYEKQERRRRLQKAIAELPDSQRKTFLLYYQGYSYEEIATQLDAPVGTIKGRVHRARLKLVELCAVNPSDPRPKHAE